MDKGGGSSSRLISTLMRRRPTGGDSDVYLDKSSKKKLRRLSSMGLLLGEMDQLSHSINTNSTTNRLKVLKKFPDHCDAINQAYAPKKLRSAMKKIDTKKHKAIAVSTSNRSEAQNPRLGFEEEFKDSKISSVMTRDEEEVAEALFALAQAGLNTTPQVEVKPPPPLPLVEETMPPNARNRCSVHVYICSFIKLLQTKIATGSNPTFDSLQQVVPYFDTMDHQHLTSTGCYGDWQSQRHDKMPPVSGSDYTEQRRCIHMSLLASDKGKMQLSEGSSGYDEKGGLFFVDGPTLNLTL